MVGQHEAGSILENLLTNRCALPVHHKQLTIFGQRLRTGRSKLTVPTATPDSTGVEVS